MTYTQFSEGIIMPFEHKALISSLRQEFHLSAKQLAKLLHISIRSLHRVKKSDNVQSKVLGDLIVLYCVLKTTGDVNLLL